MSMVPCWLKNTLMAESLPYWLRPTRTENHVLFSNRSNMYFPKGNLLKPIHLKHIIAEGIARHQRKRKSYVMKGNSIAGFGIYAGRDIKEGEVIFTGEERAHRIVTKRYIQANWNEEQKLNFRRYAYAISEEVF